MSSDPRRSPLGFGRTLAYASGQWVEAIANNSLSVFLLFYLTGACGLPGALAGAMQLPAPLVPADPTVVPALPSGGGGLYSTIADYARFAQMLLSEGRLGGRRILSAEAVKLMTTNRLPASILAKDFATGLQRIGPGRGYGFNGAVIFDPEAAQMSVGPGTYQWDGASGVWFWIDRKNNLFFVGMIQRLLQDSMPRLQEISQAFVAKALPSGAILPH